MITEAFNKTIGKLLEKEKSHFNDKQRVTGVYGKASTGSLKMDDKTGGGFSSGIITLYGITESGKTSLALKVMEGALLQGDTMCLFVKAEGRLSDNVKSRYQIDFVDSSEEWKIGNCFELKTNDYYVLIKFLDTVFAELPKGVRLCVIVDSLNGLRDNTGNGGMASTPRITSDFLSKISLPVSEYGHLFLLTSQKRAKIEGTYIANEDRDHFNMSGGNAVQNYSDWILQFAPHDQKTNQFFASEDTKRETPIGHKCLIRIKKSTNNTTNTRVDYPILYGREGSEVWLEQELLEYMQMWDFISKPNPRASFIVSDYVVKETKDSLNIDLPETFRTEAKLMEFFYENTNFVDFWAEKIKERIKKPKTGLFTEKV